MNQISTTRRELASGTFLFSQKSSLPSFLFSNRAEIADVCQTDYESLSSHSLFPFLL